MIEKVYLYTRARSKTRRNDLSSGFLFVGTRADMDIPTVCVLRKKKWVTVPDKVLKTSLFAFCNRSNNFDPIEL